MGLEKLSLASLANLDGGRIRAALEQALKRCESDCKDRPALRDARTVTLKIKVLPVADDEGLDSCDVTFQITDSVPTRKSKVYNMKSTTSGLVFNEMSPDDVRQMTIDQAQGPKEVVSDVG